MIQYFPNLMLFQSNIILSSALKRVCLVGFFISLLSPSFAQGELPPISIYSYPEHGGGMQNWMIDQSDNLNIYVANNEGLLEFDGEQWKLYPTDNQTLMRSVMAHNNRVYSGCYMDFGFWESDSTGYLVYQSLVPLLAEPMIEDEQVWNIHHSDDWVIFQSLNRIFLYQSRSQQIRTLDFPHDIIRSFQVEEDIYFQSINQGLYKIKNGKAELVSDSEIFQNQVIIGLFSLDNQMVAISDDARWIEIQKEKVEINELRSIEKGATIYSAAKLTENELVLGTISLGVLIVDSNGNITGKYDQNDGMTNNTVLSICSDEEGSLWIGLDNGVNVIHRESMLRIAKFEEDIGAVYASRIVNGIRYLGTNQGLYYKKETSTGTAYKLCNETQGQVWNLEVIDDLLFCGHNNGVYVIDGENVIKHISEIKGAWTFRKVPNTKDLILVGSYSNSGLHILEKRNQSWSFRNHIANYRMSSRFLEWIDDSSLIVNHEYKGVYKIVLDKKYESALKVTLDKSVEKGRHSGLTKHDGKILYSRSDGLWVYDVIQNKFLKDNELSILQRPRDYISGKIVSSDYKLWFFTTDYVHNVSKDRFDGAYEIKSIPLIQSYREGNFGYENINHIRDELFLLGSSSGYSIIDLGVASLSKNQGLRISDVYASSNLNDLHHRISIEGNIQLDHLHNNIRIDLTSNTYDPAQSQTIEYRLNDEAWHQLNGSNSIELNQLTPGSYLLQARAEGEREGGIQYSFEISKPWYETHLALIGFSVGFVLLFYMINNAYARYYKKEEMRLIEENRKALALKELETEQRITMMENEKLQLEIENKNRELGISTMHMTKQNEILGTIRAELAELKGGKEVKSIIRLVDKNMNPEEDWNMFEKAFNEADKDFFKKVKLIHPGLTANDLKLCAYLRLNLSSKEMAPLLNISPRSVEIKRYRLRKKLGMDHKVGLAEYILGL